MRIWRTTTMLSLVAGGIVAISADGWAQVPVEVPTEVPVEVPALTATPAGTYTLTQVAGADLPVVTEQDEDGCREEILTGTLTLDAAGTWRLTFSERETCGAEVEEDQEEEDGSFTVMGQMVHFSDDDESDDPVGQIDVDELGMGTLSDEGLSITLQDKRTVLTFTK